MPQFKSYDDKHFKTTNIKTRVNDLSVDKPKVNQVIFEIPGEKEPQKITVKPRKTVSKKQDVGYEDFSIEAEAEETVSYSLGGVPEIFKEISRALQSEDVVECKALITRGTFENDDGSTDTHYFIRNDQIDTLELLDPKPDQENKESMDEPEGF